MTRFRFFAAARAAVGLTETTVEAATLGDALAAIGAQEPRDPDRWESLAERCSYLVDGVTTQDRGTPLAGVGQVDVMPPFAGG